MTAGIETASDVSRDCTFDQIEFFKHCCGSHSACPHKLETALHSVQVEKSESEKQA